MTPDDPRHGEYRGYHQHLRDDEKPCDPCDEAALKYRRRRQKMAVRGMPRRLPIGEKIHARLTHALDHGMSQDSIAEAIGVSPSCVWRYTKGPDMLVAARTWVKLNAFRPQPVLTTIGTIRRVQALHHLGYSCAAIAREAGCHKETLTEMLGGRDVATHRLRKAIADAHNRLWATPCPDSPRVTMRAKNRAIRAKWAPTQAWDDETIDDPAAKPVGLTGRYIVGDYIDEAAVLRRMAGDRVTLTKEERIEVVRRLRAAQWTFGQIEEHTGLNVDRYIAREKAAA
jgi:lambda repressor-like predicted transcriptional regulator